jgi:purine-binding chemotaxis protein CheW
LVGLGNLRGTILSVVSLAALMERKGGADGQRVIVLGGADGVGLLVDDVSALISDEQTRGSGRIARKIDVPGLLARNFVAPQARSHRVAQGQAVVDTSASAVSQLILLGFTIGEQLFALPVDQIDEVIRLPDSIALLPQSDDAVVGTAGHRGALLPILSLRHLLMLPGTDRDVVPRIVIARIGRHRVGLIVDAVNTIARVDEGAVDLIPAVLARGAGEARIKAICRLDGGRRLISVLDAGQLLRDDIIAQLAEAQSEEQIMVEADTAAADSEQFLIFRIGEDMFGLPVTAVSEVVRMPESLGTLPRAPAFIEGIMNLRGQAIPVIDQRRRFDAPADANIRRRVIIVSLADMQAGFVVDGVSDVVRVRRDSLQPAPDLGDGAVRIFDRVAMIGAEQRMILLVEPRELLDRAERDLLDAMNAGDAPSAP